MSSKTLLAIAAHADDFELNAGGYAAQWHRDGGNVVIIMITNNCSGGLLPTDGQGGPAYKLPPLETSAVRHSEQDTAAAMLDAKVHYMNYTQRHYWNGTEQVTVGFEPKVPPPAGIAGQLPLIQAFRKRAEILKLVALIREHEPAEVLTQNVIDLDPEHHMVAAMVWQAFLLEPSLQAVPLRFWSPGSSAPDGFFDPAYDRIVDISDTYETKLKLCHCHASQMTENRLTMLRSHAEHWGATIGVKYAEPFKTATIGRCYQLPS